jgi:hypothetical protein
MKTFYSILSAVINPVSGEKISLGMLLSDGNTSLFNFSDTRLSLVGSLIDKENKKFIKQYLKSIENVINKIDINDDQLTIFENEGKNLIVNESYIDYLSSYSQNVISFSKPVAIDVNVDQKIFESLFVKFIDEETDIEPLHRHNVEIVKAGFFPEVNNYFSIEKEFTPEHYPKVILPVTIDLFGKNEIEVIGQFLDLEKNIYHIKNDYFDYSQLTEVFPKSKKFLISSEPPKSKYPQQHYFWNEIRKQKKQDYVNIEELEIVKEYAKEHQVMPA